MKLRAATAALGLLGLSNLCAAPEKPNIVFVFIDDMGWSDLSCFGNKDASTPHIDALAAEGIRFHQFCVNAPICSPSRVAVFTGQYPQRWSIESYLAERGLNVERGMPHWLDPKAPSLARTLRDAGYATGHFGKWHLGGQRDVGEAPLIAEYGFDESLTNFEGLGPRILGLGDAHDGSAPRRISLGSDTLGHGPVHWEDRSQLTRRYTEAAIEFIDKAAGEGKPFYVNLWPDDVHSPFFPPKEKRSGESQRELYHAVLEAMDEQLAPIFDHIRDDPKLRDNTIVLFCSDNGPEYGSGTAAPLRGHKCELYEGGVRSPLIVWAPGLIAPDKAGSINRASLFSGIDLAPTLLDLAGARTSAKLDGIALPDVLLGKSDASRGAPLFFRRPPDRNSANDIEDLPDLAMRDGNWKLLCEYDGSAPELYDLEADPSETRNLAGQNPDRVKNMAAALLEWNRSMPPAIDDKQDRSPPQASAAVAH